MKPKVKKILVVGSVIGVIGLITFAVIMWGKRKKIEADILSGSPDMPEVTKPNTTTVSFPLKKGSGSTINEKNAVKVVQKYINIKSLTNLWFAIVPLTEDGIFGPLTESALYKLTGTKEVSYSFYKEMENYLTPVPYAVSS